MAEYFAGGQGASLEARRRASEDRPVAPVLPRAVPRVRRRPGRPREWHAGCPALARDRAAPGQSHGRKPEAVRARPSPATTTQPHRTDAEGHGPPRAEAAP